jgi:hypothetical protein
VPNYSRPRETYCKNVHPCYSQPMKSRSKGYEVTDIAGRLERIEINAVEAATETYVEITLFRVGEDPPEGFDRAGFSELLNGLHKAAMLATLLANQIADGDV